MLTFRQAEIEQMKRIENEVAGLLAKYRDNTEAGIVVFALVRCARTLLRLYPESTEQQLARVVADFLEDRAAPRDDPEAGMLVM
jgi:hypothetical protein